MAGFQALLGLGAHRAADDLRGDPRVAARPRRAPRPRQKGRGGPDPRQL